MFSRKRTQKLDHELQRLEQRIAAVESAKYAIYNYLDVWERIPTASLTLEKRQGLGGVLANVAQGKPAK